MMGEPFDLKPSTSSREWPPLQTVAPNTSLSRAVVVRPKRNTLMPHDGSGTRSGRDAAGGLLSVGTLAGSRGRVPCEAGCRLDCRAAHGWNGPQLLGLSTLILTKAVEIRGVRRKNRCHVRGMFTVTGYLPRPRRGARAATSAPQPPRIP